MITKGFTMSDAKKPAAPAAATKEKPKKPAAPKKPTAAPVPGRKPKTTAAPRPKTRFGERPTDPESLFGLLMAARRQGGGILEERALEWLLAIGIKVTFPKSRAVAHVTNGG